MGTAPTLDQLQKSRADKITLSLKDTIPFSPTFCAPEKVTQDGGGKRRR